MRRLLSSKSPIPDVLFSRTKPPYRTNDLNLSRSIAGVLILDAAKSLSQWGSSHTTSKQKKENLLFEVEVPFTSLYSGARKLSTFGWKVK